VALVGLSLATVIAGRVFPHRSLADLVDVALFAWAPVGLPWMTVLLFGFVKPARTSLTWIELAFYAGLLAYDVALFVYLPALASRSEGFVMIPVWGLTLVLSCLVVAVEAYGRWAEARRSRSTGATSTGPSRSGRDPRSPAP
jgi:hypothetical protein